MTFEELQERVGKRVRVRPPRRLWKRLGLNERMGKLERVYKKKRTAARAVVDFGKDGVHEVRTAEVVG